MCASGWNNHADHAILFFKCSPGQLTENYRTSKLNWLHYMSIYWKHKQNAHTYVIHIFIGDNGTCTSTWFQSSCQHLVPSDLVFSHNICLGHMSIDRWFGCRHGHYNGRLSSRCPWCLSLSTGTICNKLSATGLSTVFYSMCHLHPSSSYILGIRWYQHIICTELMTNRLWLSSHTSWVSHIIGASSMRGMPDMAIPKIRLHGSAADPCHVS